MTKNQREVGVVFCAFAFAVFLISFSNSTNVRAEVKKIPAQKNFTPTPSTTTVAPAPASGTPSTAPSKPAGWSGRPELRGEVYLTREAMTMDDLSKLLPSFYTTLLWKNYSSADYITVSDIMLIPVYILNVNITSFYKITKMEVRDFLGSQKLIFTGLADRCLFKSGSYICSFRLFLSISKKVYEQLGFVASDIGIYNDGTAPSDACYPQYDSALKKITDLCASYASDKRVIVQIEAPSKPIYILLSDANNFFCGGVIKQGAGPADCSVKHPTDVIVESQLAGIAPYDNYVKEKMQWMLDTIIAETEKPYYETLYANWNGVCDCLSPTSGSQVSCKGEFTYTDNADAKLFQFTLDETSKCTPPAGTYQYNPQTKQMIMKP